MSVSRKKIKAQPLTPKDIKRVLFEGDVKISHLAQKASKDLKRVVTPWQVRAVIYRFPDVVYQDIREWLAGYLGCDVSQVGNEPSPRTIARLEAEAAA
jgi:hypothetical protein